MKPVLVKRPVRFKGMPLILRGVKQELSLVNANKLARIVAENTAPPGMWLGKVKVWNGCFEITLERFNFSEGFVEENA